MAYTTCGMWMKHVQQSSWCANTSKINIWFDSSPIILCCEGHSSFIQSVGEVHDYLMKTLFYKLANGSDITSISCWEGLKIIIKSCHCLYRRLHRLLSGLSPNNQSWDLSHPKLLFLDETCKN